MKSPIKKEETLVVNPTPLQRMVFQIKAANQTADGVCHIHYKNGTVLSAKLGRWLNEHESIAELESEVKSKANENK